MIDEIRPMSSDDADPPRKTTEDVAAFVRNVEAETIRATSFAAFEPNDEVTWEKVRLVIASGLNKLWEQGALAGSTSDEAYFVEIGAGETMTQQDIDDGRLIAVVGIAPLYPAEFVVFQITQFTQPG